MHTKISIIPLYRAVLFCGAVFFLLYGKPVNAQQNYIHYTIKDGLPQMQCMDILQDKKGYLWIGTKGGISRFDGLVFKNYTRKEGLIQDQVRHIAEDSKATIWFTNKNGLSCISKNMIQHFSYNKAGYALHRTILVDKHDNVWFIWVTDQGTHEIMKFNNGVFNKTLTLNSLASALFYDKSTDKVYYSIYENKIQNFYTLGNDKVCFASKKERHLWLVIINEVVYVQAYDVNKKMNHVSIYKNGQLHTFDSIKGKQVGLLTKDYKGELIYSDKLGANTEGQLYKIEKGKKKYFGSSFSQINKVINDHEGNFWLISEFGLYKLVAFNNYTEKDGMPPYVWSVVEDKQNRVWFAPFRNGYLYYMQNNKIHRYDKDFGSAQFYFNARTFSNGTTIFPFSPDVMVLNNNTFYNKRFPKSATTLSICEDTASNTKYYATTLGIYTEKPENTHVLDTTFRRGIKGNVLDMEQAPNGTVWYGTSKYFGTLNLEKNIEYKLDTTIVNRAISLSADYKSSIWIASVTGLHLYANRKLYSIKHNELEDLIYSIAEIDSTHLVYGGARGIGILDIEACYKAIEKAPNKTEVDAETFVNYYDQASGFMGEEVGQSGIYNDSQGRVWVPTSTNVVMFRPKDLRRNTLPPHTHITGFASSTDNISWTQQPDSAVQLHHTNKNLRFNYTGISLSAPHLVKYKYRLLNFNNAWSKSTKERYVNFTNIPPGKYRFELLAANSNGVWNTEPVAKNFWIVPAWWQTLWAKIGFILAAIGFVYLFFYVTYKVRQRKKEADKKMHELQQQASHGQLYPHFLYNGIAGIGSFFLKEQPEVSYDYLVKLANIMRAILKKDGEVYVTIEEELEFVQDFLDLQKMRFADRFDFGFEIASDIEVHMQLKIPQMLLQTYVENAIKHGLEGNQSGGQLVVGIKKQNKQLFCYVQDNGIGFIEAEKRKTGGTKKGRKNMQDIVDYHNKRHSRKIQIRTIHLHQFNKKGTRIEVQIDHGKPLKSNSKLTTLGKITNKLQVKTQKEAPRHEHQ